MSPARRRPGAAPGGAPRRAASRPRPAPHPLPAHATAPAAAAPPVGVAEATAVSDLFRTLADPTRLQILALLAEGEACVHVICGRLGMSQSAVSHQLRLLRIAHLVRPRRAGREVYYATDDEHVTQLIREGRRHAGCAGPDGRSAGPRPTAARARRGPGARP